MLAYFQGFITFAVVVCYMRQTKNGTQTLLPSVVVCFCSAHHASARTSHEKENDNESCLFWLIHYSKYEAFAHN